jgi:hypothetical protein
MQIRRAKRIKKDKEIKTTKKEKQNKPNYQELERIFEKHRWKHPEHVAEYKNDPPTAIYDLFYSHKYLYLIRAENGRTKIGISCNPKRRLTEIRQSGFYAEILCTFMPEPTIDLSAKYLEKILHEYFEHKKVFNEWFDLSKSDILCILNTSLGDLIEYYQDNLFETVIEDIMTE